MSDDPQQSRSVSPRSHANGPARSGHVFIEVNFDGLVGPTHNYAGLSPGNLASAKHADTVSRPKQAALQGLAKMKLLRDLGVPQAVLPPHPRPDLHVLRQLGFVGTDAELIASCYHEDPKLLAAVYSSSAMWAANAATISPAPDTADGRVNITPANLLTQFHRSIEPPLTSAILKQVFSGDGFVHHEPLPAADAFADEGAANHLRLCAGYGGPGLEIFVYGRNENSGPTRYPARQTEKACAAIARRHGLDPNRTMILRQSPEAIDAGVFHNDVVSASNLDLLMVHRQAFADADAIQQIRLKCAEVTGQEPWIFVAEADELSLADAVSTYLFNSQIVTVPDKTMAIIAPLECREHPGVQSFLSRVMDGDSPIKAVHYIDLRQSMHNGGGPACLRLRVVMTEQQASGLLLDDMTFEKLTDVINRRYRDELAPEDLADPLLMSEARVAIDEIIHARKSTQAASSLSVLA
jgi:succinylarginine dihydrolase